MEPFDHDASRPSHDPFEAFDDEDNAEPYETTFDQGQAEDGEAMENENDPTASDFDRNQPPDERAQSAKDFLRQVLIEMDMDVSIERHPPRPDSSIDEIHLEIVGHDVGRVIGKKGQVLSALQYLVNRAVNRPGLPRRHIVLDAEGYRHRRETNLASLARRLGEQAAKEGKIITFEPMSPRDRRVVHLALAKFPHVVTKSDGEGEERRVRIIPVRR